MEIKITPDQQTVLDSRSQTAQEFFDYEMKGWVGEIVADRNKAVVDALESAGDVSKAKVLDALNLDSDFKPKEQDVKSE